MPVQSPFPLPPIFRRSFDTTMQFIFSGEMIVFLILDSNVKLVKHSLSSSLYIQYYFKHLFISYPFYVFNFLISSSIIQNCSVLKESPCFIPQPTTIGLVRFYFIVFFGICSWSFWLCFVLCFLYIINEKHSWVRLCQIFF